jgi:hypothetical protein
MIATKHDWVRITPHGSFYCVGYGTIGGNDRRYVLWVSWSALGFAFVDGNSNVSGIIDRVSQAFELPLETGSAQHMGSEACPSTARSKLERDSDDRCAGRGVTSQEKRRAAESERFAVGAACGSADLASSTQEDGPVLSQQAMSAAVAKHRPVKTALFIRVVIVFILSAIVVDTAARPALSFNFEGMWVGNIKGFAANHTQMEVYSSYNRRSLLFIIAPGTPITSADGTKQYPHSALKVGTLVRVHVNMPYGWDAYYGYGVTIGAMYITRIDILTGSAVHSQIHETLKQTLPSPSPRPSPTVGPSVPIIFVSPTPASK